jgi:hypothetical protein
MSFRGRREVQLHNRLITGAGIAGAAGLSALGYYSRGRTPVTPPTTPKRKRRVLTIDDKSRPVKRIRFEEDMPRKRVHKKARSARKSYMKKAMRGLKKYKRKYKRGKRNYRRRQRSSHVLARDVYGNPLHYSKKLQKRNVFDGIAKGGTVYTETDGGILTEPIGTGKPETVYIGHSSFALKEAYINTFLCFLKMVMEKVNTHMLNPNDYIHDPNASNSNMTITVRYSKSNTTAVLSQGFTITTATSTWLSVAISMASFFYGLNTATLNLFGVSVAATTSATNFIQLGEFDLMKCYIEIAQESILRMQNQCFNASGDNLAVSTDNVPLVGRCYKASGTGLLPDRAR